MTGFSYTFSVGWLPNGSKATLKSMDQVAAGVAAMHGFTLAEIKGRCRQKRICQARFAVIAALRAERNRHGEPRWSLPAIGRFLNRDHTTIIHALRRVEAATGVAACARCNSSKGAKTPEEWRASCS